MKSENYFLPRNYIHQKEMIPWDDTTCHNEVYQREVYLLAANLMRKNPQWNSVIDIGCGSGYKLMKYFHQYDTIGVDLPVALTFLHKEYSGRDWREYNNHLWATCSPDILICADVIEHVEEPDAFLINLQFFNTVKKFVISTPDRVLVRGPYDHGPPANPAHYREWTLKEFQQYLSCFFKVEHISIVRPAHGTIVAVCTHY